MKHWGHGWVPGDEAAEPAEWGSVCWENSLVVQEIWRRWFTGKGRSLSTDQTVHLRSLNLDPIILSYNEHYPLAEEKKKGEEAVLHKLISGQLQQSMPLQELYMKTHYYFYL